MDSLPQQFVTAMRTLFDIMDDNNTGFVKLTDIENRWRNDRIKGLPKGVIENLRKAASHDGLLTFDRFCTGLKMCLLRNQVDRSLTPTNTKENNLSQPHSRNLVTNLQRPGFMAPPSGRDNENKWNGLNLTDKLPHQQHKNPTCQLEVSNDDQMTITDNRRPINLNSTKYEGLFAPPKPPRLERPGAIERKEMSSSELNISNKASSSGGDIECRLESRPVVEQQGRGHGDGRPDAESAQALQRRAARRREPRRHTLHNGIDYNLLKRMKQIELEKDILLQGLSAVEDAREWYLKQLAEVQEKMRFAGRLGAYVEPWNEAQQERVEILRARVSELSRQLGALAAGWWQGPLSLHMNLALPTQPAHVPQQRALDSNRTNMLTTQNKMLLEEVSRKNDKISSLECEKTALIRELLSQRSQKKSIDNY